MNRYQRTVVMARHYATIALYKTEQRVLALTVCRRRGHYLKMDSGDLCIRCGARVVERRFPTNVKKVDRCPLCGHAPHTKECWNMASDHGCECLGWNGGTAA